MAGYTLKTANRQLQMWLKAECELATSQSYTIGTRTLTRANLSEVRKQIEFWNNEIAKLENIEKRGGRNRAYRVIPRDL